MAEIVIRIVAKGPTSAQTDESNVAMVVDKHLPRLERFFGDRYVITVEYANDRP